jgi:hypothetical protein
VTGRTFVLACAAACSIALGGTAVVSCKAPLVFSDPTTQAVTCEITKDVLSLLESLAVSVGIPIQVVESLYSEGCATAAKEGLTQDQAMRYGYEHAQARAYRMAFERKVQP